MPRHCREGRVDDAVHLPEGHAGHAGRLVGRQRQGTVLAVIYLSSVQEEYRRASAAMPAQIRHAPSRRVRELGEHQEPCGSQADLQLSQAWECARTGHWPFRKNTKMPASAHLPHGSWCSLPSRRRSGGSASTGTASRWGSSRTRWACSTSGRSRHASPCWARRPSMWVRSKAVNIETYHDARKFTGEEVHHHPQQLRGRAPVHAVLGRGYAHGRRDAPPAAHRRATAGPCGPRAGGEGQGGRVGGHEPSVSARLAI